MRGLTRRTLAAGLTAMALTSGVAVATAAPAVAEPCGYYEVGSVFRGYDKYYNHCGSDYTYTKITRSYPLGPQWRCLKPGITKLDSRTGVPKHVIYARSWGDPCP